MSEFSTSVQVGLVKYTYDEQLAVILVFQVCSLVSESALDMTFGCSKQGASQLEDRIDLPARSQPKFQF